MQYAINTLQIELYKQLESIRVVNRYQAHPEYCGTSYTYERNATELQKAIAHLQAVEPKFDINMKDKGSSEQWLFTCLNDHKEAETLPEVEVCSWCLDVADVEIKVNNGHRFCCRCGRNLHLS